LKNTNAIDFLKQYTRDPYPSRVVWDLETQAPLRSVKSFYWLRLEKPSRYGKIVASYDQSSNRVTIENEAIRSGFTVLLNSKMLDLSKPVYVNISEQEFEIIPQFSTELIRETAFERGDPNYIFSAGIYIYYDDEWIIEAL
jgi:hypothetical protein